MLGSFNSFGLRSGRPGFRIASLFRGGAKGAALLPYDISTSFQDVDGTTPVDSTGDPVGLEKDTSTNQNDAKQAVALSRPEYTIDGEKRYLKLDKIDDNMTVSLPGVTEAYVIMGTLDGIIQMKIAVTNEEWSFTVDPSYFPGDNIVGLIIRDVPFSTSETSSIRNLFINNGAGSSQFMTTTTMREWFRSRTDILEIDVSNWDTSNVADFNQFARDCSSLTTLDVSNWNTANVINFSLFAYNCSSLTTLDVSNWNTGNVTNFSQFAFGCSSLTTLDVSNWDTANVTNFREFAYNCSSLTTLDTSNWNTGNVTNFRNFARGCSSLTTLDTSNWNTDNVINFNQFARDCSSLTTLDVSNWNTANVINFSLFAYNCSSLTTLDVSNWNTGNVTNFNQFAFGCSSLTTLDVSNWDTANVTNFREFAYNCSSLTTLDTSNWNTGNVTNFRNFARDCSNLTTITVNGGTGNPFADSPCIDYSFAFSNTNLTQQSIDDILVAINTANTSNGTFDQSGGSAPSATGQAAIDDLRSRGWTITVTGGY